MWSKGGMLHLPIDDQLPERRWKRAAIGLFGFMKLSEQDRHAMGIKALRLSSKRALGCTRLLCALCRRATEEYDRPDQLIDDLLWPLQE